jgi:predicted TIM-barrel fold metal-dependent hydrolase
MTRDKDNAIIFLKKFSKKIMFGTDICSKSNTHHIRISAFYDSLYEDGLITYTEYRDICRDNAIRILKLEE